MKKAIGMFVALILALGMIGVAYACWSDTLYLNGTIATGDLSVAIEDVWHTCADDGGVATCNVTLADEHHLKIDIGNGYPCYWCFVDVDIHNDGTIPAKFAGWDYKVTGDLAPWVEIDFECGEWEGTYPYLEPCDWICVHICIHIACMADLDGDGIPETPCPMDSSATISGSATFVQFNE